MALGEGIGKLTWRLTNEPEKVKNDIAEWWKKVERDPDKLSMMTGELVSSVASGYGVSKAVSAGGQFVKSTAAFQGFSRATGSIKSKLPGVLFEDVGQIALKKVPDSGSLRKRVLSNINESKVARESSNFELYSAKESQVLSSYKPDIWKLGKLEKGSIVYGGLSGQSSFYTDFAAVKSSGLKASDLFQSIQVTPHSVYGYRSRIGAYRVKEAIDVPQGKVLANPAFGVGGQTQFRIRDYNSKLELIRTFNLTR